MTKISAARPAVASHPREKAADLKPIATAFGLGKLVSTERGPMGRVLHNYANGTLVTKGGRVHSLEVSDVENSPVLLSKELIDLALKNKLGWDDALDVWGVHGVGGFIGIIFLGVFASTEWNSAATGGVDGLLRGNTNFFLVQCAAVAVSSVWAMVFTLGMLWLIDLVTPVKVSQETEALGLDAGLHGEQAYVGGI